MKLTEEHEDCECNDMLDKTDVSMPHKCHVIHEDTLDLYDYYKEKAEKWDNIRRNATCVDNVELRTLIFQVDKENKQLQRDYSHLLKQKKDCEDRSYIMEQKLSKIEELNRKYMLQFQFRKELKYILDQ